MPKKNSLISVNLKVNSGLAKKLKIKKELIEVRAVDVSSSGIGVLSRYQIPRGTIVNLEIIIKEQTLEMEGEIILVFKHNSGLTRFGIKFLDVAEEKKKVLSKFIKSHDERVYPRLILS